MGAGNMAAVISEAPLEVSQVNGRAAQGPRLLDTSTCERVDRVPRALAHGSVRWALQALNRYAWPASLARSGAPTTTVVPEMTTETPKPSSATVSEPFSSAACFHPLAVLVNT